MEGDTNVVAGDEECLIIVLLYTVNYAKNPATYFAKRAYASMKGAGTNDRSLIRVIASRSEVNILFGQKIKLL